MSEIPNPSDLGLGPNKAKAPSTNGGYTFADAKRLVEHVAGKGYIFLRDPDWQSYKFRSITHCRSMLGIPFQTNAKKISNTPHTSMQFGSSQHSAIDEILQHVLNTNLSKEEKKQIRDNTNGIASTQVVDRQAPAPKQKQQSLKQSSGEDLVQWVWAIRNNIVKAQAAGVKTKRVAGTRMIQAGVKLLKAGVKLQDVKSRLIVGWTGDEQDKFIGSRIPETKFKNVVEEGVFLINAGFENIFFCGPPGCGKTTLAAGIAKQLNLEFEAMPCFDELPASATYGKMVADGSYVPTSFTKIFENGGVFLFDEIFKASPAVSVALNMALANGYFYNPAAGRVMKRHKNCYILGASNTFGNGSAIFNTDQPQDPAFLDRFIGAAVNVNYDVEYELSLIKEL